MQDNDKKVLKTESIFKTLIVMRQNFGEKILSLLSVAYSCYECAPELHVQLLPRVLNGTTGFVS